MAAPSARRFLVQGMAAFVTTLALMAGLNIAVDPYGEFGTRLVPPDDSDRHSRALKVALVRHGVPPESLILGNSRSMQLSPRTAEALTGLRTFNGATAAGSAFDVLAFTRLAVEGRWPLRMMIVGLDTFMLEVSQPRAELRYFPLVRYLPEFVSPVVAQLNRAGRTSSATTAWLSGEQLYYWRHERIRNFAFDADGRIRYLPYDEWVDAGSWRSPLPFALDSVRSQYVKYYNEEQHPTANAIAALELWLQETERAHVAVAVFLPPLHAYLRRSLERETRYPEELAAYRDCITRLQQRFDFRFYDLSSVDRFGGDDRWFIDGTRMVGPNNDLVLRAVLADVPRSRASIAVR